MTRRTRLVRRPRPRPLRSVVLRLLVPRVVVFAAFAAMLGVGQAVAADTAALDAALPAAPSSSVLPAWTLSDAARFPDCRAADAWPVGEPARYVVVQDDAGGRHRRLEFGLAWQLNHNPVTTDDVWVVGVCGGPGQTG